MALEEIDPFKHRDPTFQTLNDNYQLPNEYFIESPNYGGLAFVSLTNDQLILTPIHHSVRKVIDIGCGTGIVTQELRKQFPDAEHVYGIDLTKVNPSLELDNAATESQFQPTFIHGDFMALAGVDARLAWGSVDFAWSRFLLCGMKDWQRYTDHVFKLLKPGAWTQMVEFAEDFYFDPLLSERPHGYLAREQWSWLLALRDAGARKGLDMDAGWNVAKHMRVSGFVDVQHMQFTVPYWWSIVDTRPEARLAVKQHLNDPYALYWHMIPRMLESLGYSQQQIRQFQNDSVRDCGEELGKYQVLHIITGRKPEG
ncbi:MAG: hypothetical protein Q9227_002512 [Pyrenula ochraceoflavens]